MPFSPLDFERVDLPVLLHELARRDPSEIAAGLDRISRLSPKRVRGGSPPPADEWQTQLLTAPDPFATVSAVNHPPVVAADVELGKYLGSGSQGAVYRSHVKSTGLVVAVKVINGDDAAHEQQAIREAKIGAKLNHPGILRIFEAQKAGRFWVVVMEFLQGPNLSGVSLPPPEVKRLAASLAEAIVAMAQARVVHRDIKPGNIVRRVADNSPVIVDFGLAVDLDELTEKPTIAGTPVFMAPEAYAGAWPDSSWDAYSLGITVAYLFARDRFQYGNSLDELMTSKVQGRFDRQVIEMLDAIEDSALARWCERILTEPDNRFTVMREACSWRS